MFKQIEKKKGRRWSRDDEEVGIVTSLVLNKAHDYFSPVKKILI